MAQIVAMIAKARTMRASRRRTRKAAGATVIDGPPAVRAERTRSGTAGFNAESNPRGPRPASSQDLHHGKDQHAAERAVRARASAAAGGPCVRVELDHHEPIVLARRPEVAGRHPPVLWEARLRGRPVDRPI